MQHFNLRTKSTTGAEFTIRHTNLNNWSQIVLRQDPGRRHHWHEPRLLAQEGHPPLKVAVQRSVVERAGKALEWPLEPPC